MLILAIETSCDETAISVIEASGGFRAPNFKILSNIVSSQIKIHAPFGGVVPNLAKREHQRNLVPVLKTVLKEARLLNSKIKNPRSRAQHQNKYGAGQASSLRGRQKSKLQIKNQNLEKILERETELLEQFIKQVLPLKVPNIDAIAVTIGPGLEPALWVGINFAKALSFIWSKPLIPVNHMEGHLFSVFLRKNRKKNFQFSISNFQFPAIALLVSGGHTQLVLMENWLKYKIIGETLDDAAGEAFDKAARLLNLGYPGGPAIAAEAAQNQKLKIPAAEQARYGASKNQNYISKFQITLPRPMINSKDYNFSFSGLKTAVLYLIGDLKAKNANIKKLTPAIAYEFENAVVEVLIKKTLKAAQEYKVKSVILAGGVAANKKLRLELGEALEKNLPPVKYFLPDPEFTGDNAAMIANAGYPRFFKKEVGSWNKIKAESNLKLR